MPVADVAELYRLPLERFVLERDRLAKELRNQGRREEAARIARLHKPSLPAWAVNQLVRTQATAVAELFAAGDALSHVQGELLAARGDSVALRTAMAVEREAVDRLIAAARELRSGEKRVLSAGALERVAETLHAAALEQRAREAVAPGCLARELRHVGLGDDGDAAARPAAGRKRAAAEPERPAAKRKRAAAEPERRAARWERPAAERERAAAARERAAAARRAEATARREAATAARKLEAAQRRRDGAADALSEAEAALVRAREQAEQAERVHRAARESLSTDG